MRGFWAGALAVVGCFLVPLSAAAIWLDRTLLDTETYVETVAPLPQNEAVADSLSASLVEAAMAELDARPVLRRAAQARIDSSGVAAETVRDYVDGTVRNVIAGERFGSIWVAANRQAHPLLREILTGERPAERVELDLSPAVDAAVQDAAAELELALPIPDDIGRVELLREDDFSQIERAINNLERAARWLPIVTGIALLLALLLSRRRVRTLTVIGLLSAALGVAAIFALRTGRDFAASRATDRDLSSDAIVEIWDTLTRGLADFSWMIVGGGLLLAIAAVLLGRLISRPTSHPS